MNHQSREIPPMLQGDVSGLMNGVRSGVLASAAARFAILGLQLVSTAVLARLLSPGDYGLAALVMAVTGFAAILVDAGVASSVIQREDLTSTYLSTAIWFSTLISAGVTIVVIVAGIPLSIAFGQPQLVGLTALGSLSILLTFDAVPIAVLKRAMAFGLMARITTISTVVGVVATVAMAWFGGGAYSLVVGPVVQRVISMVMSWSRMQWRPGFEFDKGDMRHMWRFGRGLTGYFVITYWSSVLDRFVIGKTVNLAALGQYNRASNLVNLPMQQTTGILTSVFYPAFARLQGDLPRQREAWRRLVYVAWAAGLPVGATLFVVREELVGVLYGVQWQPVGPLLGWMSLSIPFLLLSGTVAPVFEALGRTGLQFRTGLCVAVSGLGILAASAPFGLLAIARAYALRGMVSAAVDLPVAMRLVGLSPKQLLRTLAGTVIGTTVATLVTLCANALFLESREVPALARLLSLVALMMVLTGATVLIVDRRQLAAVLGGRAARWLRVSVSQS